MQGGEFVSGPCRSMLVDCVCREDEEPNHCAWCCGTGLVTEKVSEAIIKETIEEVIP